MSVSACAKFFGLFALLGFVGFTSQAAIPDLDQIDDSNNLSQLIRSNTGHYWAWTKANPGALKSYSAAEGILVGDAHLGNFNVIPVKLKSGRRDLRFLCNDFDDSGRGPFVYDFARLAITAKATTDDVRLPDLVSAYLNGLQDHSMPVPSEISTALQISLSDYEDLRRAAVLRKTEGDHFLLKPGSLEAWSGTPGLNEIAPLFANAQILDVAHKILERGGSKDSLRLWVLVKDLDHRLHIYELKAVQQSGLNQYEPQAAPLEILASVYQYYWSGIDPQSYSMIQMQQNWFWIREKKVPLYVYDHKSEKVPAMIFVANQLGLLHGQQPGADDYRRLIEQDPDAFRAALKTFSHAYIDVVKAQQ